MLLHIGDFIGADLYIGVVVFQYCFFNNINYVSVSWWRKANEREIVLHGCRVLKYISLFGG
jgi:hypothetical protein